MSLIECVANNGSHSLKGRVGEAIARSLITLPEVSLPPTLGNGKICYVEIPALDVRRSAEFYSKVFGWQIRQRGDGATAFDDGVGQVSGGRSLCPAATR